MLGVVFLIANIGQAQNISDLSNKGITIDQSHFSAMSKSDQSKLVDYNFDSYRMYNEESIVQLVNGPQIKLASILDQQKNGFTIDEAVVNKKKNQVKSNMSLVYRVDIGLGRNPVDTNYEKWER